MNEILFALYIGLYGRIRLAGEIILWATCAAPTAGNQQPYTILDITDQSIEDKLTISYDNQPFMAQAVVALIFCVDCQKWYDMFNLFYRFLIFRRHHRTKRDDGGLVVKDNQAESHIHL